MKPDAGLRVEPAQLEDHLGQVLVVDVADPLQALQVAPGEKLEIVEQRLHRGVEPVALGELDGQALAEVPRADAGGVEALHDRQRRQHVVAAGAEPQRDLVWIVAHVAGLVDQVDQVARQRPLARQAADERELALEVVLQRAAARDGRLDEVLVAVAAAALVADAAHAEAERRGVRRPGFGAVVDGARVAVEVGGDGSEPVAARRAHEVERIGVARRRLRLLLAGHGGFALRLLEQRIALQLVLDIGGEIEARQLQQLDRLHQLRRHHQ